MRARARLAYAAGWTLCTLICVEALGFRINTTNSMPVGVWRLSPLAGALQRGEVVTVCLPDGPAARLAAERGYVPAGSCHDGREPIVKPIAALAGDLVCVTPAGITVNGIDVAGTAQLQRDTGGRPLQPVPAGDYRVQAGQVWLLAGRARNSYDSRYFAGVPVESVQSVAHPVWVW